MKAAFELKSSHICGKRGKITSKTFENENPSRGVDLNIE